MRNKCLIVILFSLVGSLYCNRVNIQVEQINIEENLKNMYQLNLSQFSTTIKYIPLKILNEDVFSGIWECEFSEKYFLAKDMSKCILYDYAGNIISRIGTRGRAPGEFQFVSSAHFGPQGYIYVQSLYDLYIYNNEGVFIKKYKNFFLFGSEYIGAWLPINDSLIFGKISSSFGNEKDKAIIFNSDKRIIKEFKNYIIFKRERALASKDEHYANIYQFENDLFFKEKFNDTLFSLSKEFKLLPRFFINLGKFSEPLSERAKLPTEKNTSKTGYFIYINNVFQTNEYLFLDCNFSDHFPAKRLTPRKVWLDFTSEFNTTSVLGIYIKTTKELLFCKPTSTDNPLFTTGLFNDIDAGPRFLPQKMINDSTMAMWIDAKKIKDHIASNDFKNIIPKLPEKKRELEELANHLTDFDNPVLMIVTFKTR